MSRLTESDDVFIWVTSEHENPKFIKQCYLKLAAYEDIGEPEELAKLKHRFVVCERALELAIKLEPISCEEVCGHDNNGHCDYSKCDNYHKEYFLQQATAEIEKENEQEEYETNERLYQREKNPDGDLG